MIIAFEAFKKELEVAVRNTTKMAKEELRARAAPTAFKGDNLIQSIKQHMPRDEYIVPPKPVDLPAGLGYLHKLPRELRDQIFSYLLTSGHPNFMRTSKVMRQEGKTWIAKEGIYRMNLGFCNGFNCRSPSRKILDTIQNVNIRINNYIVRSSTLVEYPELQLLDVLGRSALRRKTCSISFEFYGSPYAHFGHEVLSRLQRLRGFDKIVLRVWMNWTGGAAITNPLDYFHLEPPIRFRYRVFEMAREYLEPRLGKADPRSDKDGWIMVFYPRRKA